MDFETLYKNIYPRLKRLSRYHNGHGQYVGEDDLCQEMCFYLWDKYKEGMPEGINLAYIVKGCEFHVLNYLRKERENVAKISMEQPINEEGDTIKDIIRDNSRPFYESADSEMTLEDIGNSCSSASEKKVLALILEGRTVREIGGMLGISHVMVVKYKKKLIEKYRRSAESGYQSV